MYPLVIPSGSGKSPVLNRSIIVNHLYMGRVPWLFEITRGSLMLIMNVDYNYTYIIIYTDKSKISNVYQIVCLMM